MLRPRARVGGSRVILRLPLLVPTLLLGLALTLAGCGGSDSDDQADGPSKEAIACRKQWKGLEQKVGGRDSLSNPSALAARWNSITATIDYYASSAAGKDCGKTLDNQGTAMDSLKAFGTKLAPYDMELRLDGVKTDAEAYAAAPRTPAPKASPKPKGKKKQQPEPRAPKPADIAAALKTLTTRAPLATRQQGPGWEQAKVAELGDTAAVNKTVKDLAFLSSESKAYRTCTAALAQIKKALAAKAG